MIGFERVTANQFGEAIGLMRGCGTDWPHLPKDYVEAGLCDLPRCFRTRKTAAGDMNDRSQLTIIAAPAASDCTAAYQMSQDVKVV